MRRVFDDLKHRLTGFLDQRDRAALVLDAGDDEALLVAKTLEELDDVRASELFWMHTDPFDGVETWVSGVCERFALTHAGVSMQLADEGGGPWPALPADILDGTLDPVGRLRSAMAFSRSLLPDPVEGRGVWVLWPLEIRDPEGWGRLLGTLLPHRFPAPWCSRLRIVARGLPGNPGLDAALGPVPRLSRQPAGLGRAELHAALDAEAADASLPVPRRLLSLLVSANADTSHGRPREALKKYRVLLEYHLRMRDPTMTALVWNGIGEAQWRLGNREAARAAFEEGTAPATAAEHPPIPVLLNLTLNLANLSLEDQRWPEAGGYYDAAQQFAALQKDPVTRLSAMENLGVCRYMTHDPEGALEVWSSGAHVAGELGMREARVRFLHRLRWYHGHVGDTAAQAAVDRDLAAMDAPLPPPPPGP